MRIFIAAPFFNETERKNNIRVAERLEGNSFDVFLPQRDGLLKESKENLKLEREKRLRMLLAESRAEIEKADIFILLTYGYEVDELCLIQLGMAYSAKTKAIAGLIQESNTGLLGHNTTDMVKSALTYMTDDEYMLVNYCKRVLTNKIRQ